MEFKKEEITMCLDQGLKTFKKNNNIKIGYKYYYKIQGPETGEWYYYNMHYDSYKQHSLGEWCSIDKNKFITVGSFRKYSWKDKKYDDKNKKYKSGFHFFDRHDMQSLSICVECICENITATGTQFGKKAFVAQSYRLMREV